jgi:hypothetical protein
MRKEDKTISYRIYFVALIIFFMTVTITIKLTNPQWVQGECYWVLTLKIDFSTYNLVTRII